MADKFKTGLRWGQQNAGDFLQQFTTILQVFLLAIISLPFTCVSLLLESLPRKQK